MQEILVRVSKGIIVVDINFLAIFFNRGKGTVRKWRSEKGMPSYEVNDRGEYFYNIMEVHDWKKLHIEEKFNHNRNKEINAEDEDDFKLDLPYDLEIAEIDLDNSLHLSILAAHPMGELIRDTLEFRAKQFEKEKDIEKKAFELQVRKREFLKTDELNQILTETLAMVKDIDINTRAKFPVEIADVLMKEDMITKDQKEKIQSLVSKAMDEVQNEKYKIISKQFMKHIQGYTDEATVEFLEDMIEQIKGEDDEEKMDRG